MLSFLSLVLFLGGQTAGPSLEELLSKADERAISLVEAQGPGALPVLNRFSTHSDYHVRRLVVTSAGKIANDGGGPILAAALTDSNVNVRLTAAQVLAERVHPSAKTAILEQLRKAPDPEVRESLALAAGSLPGEDTIQALRPLSKGNDRIAGFARVSLARLGDRSARSDLNDALSSSSPRERYETLELIQRTGDRTFIPAVVKLLPDQAQALRIGSTNNPRFRRVCDQALDTAVSLLGLRLPFATGPEKIYSAKELSDVRTAIPL
jgi:HEAT repeat protein